MKSILPLVLFLGLILVSYGAVFLEPLPVIPGHEGECYDKEADVFYKAGEKMKWNNKECGTATCEANDGKMTAMRFTCGKVEAPPGCYTTANLNLPYPKCCERIVCPKQRILENGA